MNIKIVSNSKHALAEYSAETSAGMDQKANIDVDIVLKQTEQTLVPKRLYIEFPDGNEAQIRPGKGLAIKSGSTGLNYTEIIDEDYRDEIYLTLIYLSDEEFVIKDERRTCQMIIGSQEKAEWKIVDLLNETKRENGGFGQTGKE